MLLERLKKEQGEANGKIRELMKTDKAAGEKARGELRAMGDAVVAALSGKTITTVTKG